MARVVTNWVKNSTLRVAETLADVGLKMDWPKLLLDDKSNAILRHATGESYCNNDTILWEKNFASVHEPFKLKNVVLKVAEVQHFQA